MVFIRHFRNITPVIDTVDQLRSHVLWLIFIRVVLFTLLLGISFLLETKDHSIILPSSTIILTFIATLYCYSIVSALVARKVKIHIQRFGLIQILSDTAFIALLVYATGCSQSIFTAVFIMPIIAGGLILYRMGGLIPASAATILYGIILASEYLQYLPSYYHASRYIPVSNYFTSMNVFAVYGLTFFLIALVSGMLAQKLRKAEDALSLTELKLDRLLILYKQIFDDIITGIITVDDEGFVTSINPAAENITGYSKEEIIGIKLESLFNIFTRKKSSERQIADLQKKDGTMIRIGFSCSSLNPPSASAQMKEYYGKESLVITLQDISRVEEMEKQVRKAEKMAAIGELSASIAHDFRNPLAAISGSAQIMAMEVAETKSDDATTLKNLSNIILRESDRMANTITNFLHYARPVPASPNWHELLKLAQEVESSFVDKKKGKNICKVHISIPDELKIFADEQLLKLTLSHLLENSCYASRNIAEPVVLSAFDDVANNQVIIEVKDQGEGIADGIRDKLFDPFFSTRDDATGMGLAIVQQIMNSHNGALSIDSMENQGCKVQLVFPKPGSTPEQP